MIRPETPGEHRYDGLLIKAGVVLPLVGAILNMWLSSKSSGDFVRVATGFILFGLACLGGLICLSLGTSGMTKARLYSTAHQAYCLVLGALVLLKVVTSYFPL